MDLSQNISTLNKSLYKESNLSVSFLLHDPKVLEILIKIGKNIKDISIGKEECKLSQY